MQFRFRHGPFQAEQEPVIEVRRIVDSIFVENERAGQRTQLDQPCQSAEFRARRETSSPITSPALPSATSLTSF